MSDMDRGRVGGDEDRLPWLEPVEEDRASAPGAGKTIAALLVGLIVIGLVVGGVFWLSAGRPAAGSGDLIAAPTGPYKVRSDQPGGMKVEGEGDTAFAASDGKETNASIDLNAIPEAPVAGAGSTPATNAPPPTARRPVATALVAPAPVAAPKPVAVPVPAVPPLAAAGGAQVQLGAFGSEAKANAAWKTLSTRFAFLTPLAKSVTPVASGGSTLYRLRASAGGQAKTVCARLKVAGETCAVIG